MVRPIFTPVFEETETAIRDRIVAEIPDDWRKEPGDFIYDAVAAVPLEVKQLQIQNDETLKAAHAQYAEGDALDVCLADVGMTRGQATPNKRNLNVTADAGVVIPQGHTVSVVVLDNDGNPLEYSVDTALNFAVTGTQALAITCKTAGTIGNVPNGSQFILLPPIPGVSAIVDAGTTILGTDTETDEAAWQRYDFKVNNPDTGGNKSDYVRWVQDGFPEIVGKAKCIPRWNGNGTVKVLLVGTNYFPALAAVVVDVQEYIDPGIQGLGEGKAPCGAAVTVAAATDLPLTITANISLYAGYTAEQVKTAFVAALQAYLKDLVFTGNVVAIAKVGSLLIGTEGVANYNTLALNGGIIDIPVGNEEVATVLAAGVTLNVV